jgi:hypothetical protein
MELQKSRKSPELVKSRCRITGNISHRVVDLVLLSQLWNESKADEKSVIKDHNVSTCKREN